MNHPTPTAMAKEAYPIDRTTSREQRHEEAMCREAHAIGSSTERRRVISWLRAEAKNARAKGYEHDAVAAELERLAYDLEGAK